MSDFSFSNLHPDIILDAIESLDLQVATGLLALNSYENRVYQFAIEGGQRYVVKFYRPMRWSDAQIQEEHDFALELHNHEIPIASPCRFNKRTLHHYEGHRFALFPSVGGRQFEVDNLDQLEWMGRFIGRIHQASKSCAFLHRPKIDLYNYLTQPRQILVESSLIPNHLMTAFMAILERLIEQTTQFYNDEFDPIRLHGDLHPGNILWRDGPSFVDLDDCRMGPAVQDIWMMLSGDRNQQSLQLETMVEAYEEFCQFNNNECKLIEPLRAMRMIHYMAWLSKRWDDPAFPLAFPWFAEDKYWENQILAMKEQYAKLEETSITLSQMI